jgi:hypothetical protein
LRSLRTTRLVAVAAALGILAAGSAAVAASAHTTVSAHMTIPAYPAIPRHAPLPGHAVVPAVATATTSTYTQLSDSSCLKAGNCVAVGEHVTAGKPAPVSDAWNGTKWTAVPVHLPTGGTVGSLFSVSCVSGRCVAVGSYTHGSAHSGLAEFYNGTTWAAGTQPAGVSGASQVVLDSVSCVASNNCVAAGFYTLASNTNVDLAIAEVWNGSTWRVSAAPKQPYSILDTVSCPAAGHCVLGGVYVTSSGSYVWAEKFDGAHWGAVSVPQPTTPAAHFQFFNGVSCPSLTSCVADGVTVNQSSNASAFTEVLSGGTWKIAGIPGWPAKQQNSLNAVSCASASYCIAVGGYGPFATLTDGKSAFAIWDGAAWHLHIAPPPPSGDGNVLFGVQCMTSASTYCILTGSQGKANTNTGVGLAGLVNNGTWTWHTTA